MRVTKQELVSFSIRRYSDEVLCDMVPMQASQIFLCRPWQFDRHINHDRYKNRYNFTKDGQNVTLAPLPPHQVYEEQNQIKKSIIAGTKRIVTLKWKFIRNWEKRNWNEDWKKRVIKKEREKYRLGKESDFFSKIKGDWECCYKNSHWRWFSTKRLISQWLNLTNLCQVLQFLFCKNTKIFFWKKYHMDYHW